MVGTADIILAQAVTGLGESETWDAAQSKKEYRNSDIAEVIDEYIHKERDRAILKDRFINGMCYEPLAEKYDLSVRHVKIIVYRNEAIVFKHLE